MSGKKEHAVKQAEAATPHDVAVDIRRRDVKSRTDFETAKETTTRTAAPTRRSGHGEGGLYKLLVASWGSVLARVGAVASRGSRLLQGSPSHDSASAS